MPMTPKCPWCGETFTAEHYTRCDAAEAERVYTLALDAGAVLGEREGEVREIRPEKVTP